MFKRMKKLKKADREELQKREQMINEHKLTAQALEQQKQAYIQQHIFPKYSLDPQQQYNIDLNTGQIKKVDN